MTAARRPARALLFPTVGPGTEALDHFSSCISVHSCTAHHTTLPIAPLPGSSSRVTRLQSPCFTAPFSLNNCAASCAPYTDNTTLHRLLASNRRNTCSSESPPSYPPGRPSRVTRALSPSLGICSHRLAFQVLSPPIPAPRPTHSPSVCSPCPQCLPRNNHGLRRRRAVHKGTHGAVRPGHTCSWRSHNPRGQQQTDFALYRSNWPLSCARMKRLWPTLCNCGDKTLLDMELRKACPRCRPQG